MPHIKQYGCLCIYCEPDYAGPTYPCEHGNGCSKAVMSPGFACCYHWTKASVSSITCGCPNPCTNNTKGTPMANEKFHVFTNGTLQHNCETLEDAKEKAQQLIRNKSLEVIIFQAILKITPKPIEVHEIDLTVPPSKV